MDFLAANHEWMASLLLESLRFALKTTITAVGATHILYAHSLSTDAFVDTIIDRCVNRRQPTERTLAWSESSSWPSFSLPEYVYYTFECCLMERGGVFFTPWRLAAYLLQTVGQIVFDGLNLNSTRRNVAELENPLCVAASPLRIFPYQPTMGSEVENWKRNPFNPLWSQSQIFK